MKKNKRYWLIMLLFLCTYICSYLSFIKVEAKNEEEKATIRVAFYPLEGFFAYDDEGNETGYGVDLLEKVSQYTGIKFQYIKADSWEDTKYMLIDDKADLRMPATKPTIPSTTLSYNSTSIISTYDALMSLNTRDDLYYQDYDTIHKLKIAVSKSFYEMNSVQKYLDTIGIAKSQLVFCEEYNECYSKLKAGEVDALISNIMDMNSQMKMITRFNNTYNYFSMLLNNPLLNVLDNALTEIQLDEPSYFMTQYAKWFPKRTTVPYTLEESQYLNSLESLTFAFRPKEGYLSHYENGTYYGIYVEMAKEICENLGVKFKAVSIDDCLAGKATTDVYAGFFYDYNYAKKWNFSISAPIKDINYYVIKKRETNFDDKTCRIAAIEKFKYTKDYVKTQYPNATMCYYATYEDCLNAVANGSVDMTIINNYIAEYYLNMYQFNNLSANLSEEYSHLYCFAASGNNELLSSLLTKGIYEISDEEMTQIYIRGQELKPESNYWLAMVYRNPIGVALLVFVVVFLVFAVIFLYSYGKSRNNQNQVLALALSAKSDFLSRMSHDMRTPMNGILGITTLMLDKEMPKEIKEGVTQIQMSGEYLLDLINDTLDMSKIESNHLELHPVATDVEEITKNILTNASSLARQKGVNLSVETIHPEKKVSVNLYIDRSRIEQIFMNLISNAVKFTPEGGNVYITIERIETEEDFIASRYTLTDTGIGMSEEFLEHLYEPFSQEGRANTERENGTGLGLSIVKQLVDLMNGEIAVESKINEGTKFTLMIHFERYKGIMKKKEEVFIDEAKLEGKRVLLCEDHPLNRQIAEKILIKKGVLVESANNGEEGLKQFENSSVGYYDAILMDLRMPVMDGYEATHAIRNLKRKDAATVPIIAMTANAFDEDVKKCLEAGMNAHISKPIDLALLYRTLIEWMN